MLLGDLGADVVKVEQPKTGDPFRSFKGGLYSPHYQACNRNKRSIELDTKDGADREVLDALVADADVYIQELPPRRRRQARRRREAPARAQPAPRLLLDQRLRPDRAIGRSPRLRHRRPGRRRLPEAARQSRKSARRRPRDRRFADRLLRRLRRHGRADRARPHRGRPHGRGLDARGHDPLQHRRLHPLLPGGRGDGPVQPAARLAVVRARVRRRQVDRAAHVVARQVLGGARDRHRAADAVRRSALRDAAKSASSTRRH